MKKFLQLFILLILHSLFTHAQVSQPISKLKTFQQSLTATDLQFLFPKDFKEIKVSTDALDVDYAVELPNSDFQVWFTVKNYQQEQAKFKPTEDEAKRGLASYDSLYNSASLATAVTLAGKDNFTYKSLPQDVLNTFRADNGKSYQLNLHYRKDTGFYQYGLLISLQKNKTGYISMLFLSNDNGPEFYKKVNKAYYSISFN